MVLFRRNRVEGGTYFFTVTLQNRNSNYLTQYISELRDSFRLCKVKMPFTIDAIVVLPEHLHCIWTLPQGDSNYSERWRKIKASFTRFLLHKEVNIYKNQSGQYNLWQRRFWEHTIQNNRDFEAHVNYIHYNPVKHGYVARARDWKYSSFHRYVREKKLSLNWAGNNNLVQLSTFKE